MRLPWRRSFSAQAQSKRSRLTSYVPRFELLEHRLVLTTFTVTSAADLGPDTLPT